MAPLVDAARVLAARDRILAAPEFNVAPDWRTRLRDWFIDLLASMGDRLPAGVRWVGLVLLLAGIVAALVWLWPRHVRGSAVRRAAAPAPARRRFSALRAEAARAL